jgi:hypothetical protein
MEYYRGGAQKFVQPIIADMHMFNLSKSDKNVSETIVLKHDFCWALQENA